MTQIIDKSPSVSAIVPARNEEAVIAACIQSLAQQPDILEVLVVDDQSMDRTVAIVQQTVLENAKIRLLQTQALPPGWVGKNYAVSLGAQHAQGEWLLFTDADALHAPDSAAKALAIAEHENAVLVSFSPEQVMETWYEKALIPYIYCRLSSRFSYDDVNNPNSKTAAANGQFLMIRRDVYESIGGHANVASEVLEDVALAKRAKNSGYRIWFGSGQGIVRTRMYRSFAAMWEGWKKNLYPLMGGNTQAIAREYLRTIGPVLATYIAAVTIWAVFGKWLTAIGLLVASVVVAAVVYDGELRRNHFSHRLVWYELPARLLFARLLWASNRSYRKGKLKWKGREYPVGTSRASNGYPQAAMVYLTRRIEFSASHLYHNPALSAEENKRIFGKCNNPHGHGHNYTLEVTVAGEPDPVTGMVLDLKELKEILEREITQRMDHRFLNYEVAELKGQIPTCENIARVIWNLLEPKITRGRLHKIRLYEVPDLFAECYRNGANAG